MLTALILSILTSCGIILSVLFFPEIKLGKYRVGTYWMIALLGALLLLLTHSIAPTSLWSGLTAKTAVNPLKILVLFLSMTALSVYLDEIGFFRYLASASLKLAGEKQTVLFYLLYVLVSVLTVFTSNDVIILTFTPFICYFTKCAGINPLPYLISEFVAANTWSMALLIGNPTNIYLGGSAGISFGAYVSVMLIPTLFAGLGSLFILRLVFARPLSEPMDPIFSEEEKPKKVPLIIGLAHLVLCTITLAISSYVGFEMWYISFGFAISLFLLAGIYSLISHAGFQNLSATLKRLPWPLVPFVLSMFTLVLTLRTHGVTEAIANLIGDRFVIPLYGVLSCLGANLLNNIPMSVLFSSILADSSLTDGSLSAGIYATIIGSNLGAFLTPLGALAGIMWSSLLKRAGISFSFRKLSFYGVIIAIPSLALALFGLWLRFSF